MNLRNAALAALILAATLPVLAQKLRAEERKFISVGMQRSAVVAKIGQPDSQTVERTRLPNETYIVEATVDTYEPAPGDDQTRTTIRYVGEKVTTVRREPVR